MPAPARAPWVRPARMPPCFPVRAFLCALVAARFCGDPRPILHTGQLPAADPTLDGNVLGGESMAARSKTFALPWFGDDAFQTQLAGVLTETRAVTSHMLVVPQPLD